jgi:hypothetical protein
MSCVLDDAGRQRIAVISQLTVSVNILKSPGAIGILRCDDFASPGRWFYTEAGLCRELRGGSYPESQRGPAHDQEESYGYKQQLQAV